MIRRRAGERATGERVGETGVRKRREKNELNTFNDIGACVVGANNKLGASTRREHIHWRLSLLCYTQSP